MLRKKTILLACSLVLTGVFIVFFSLYLHPSPSVVHSPIPNAFASYTQTPTVQSEVFMASTEFTEILPPPTATPTATSTPSPTATTTPAPTATPTPTQTPSPTPLPVTSDELDTWFKQYSSEYGTDEELLKRIAACESGFNTNAVNGDYLGLFQFATATWQSNRTVMELATEPELRRNAEEAIRTASFMLSRGMHSSWPHCSQ